ncbi:unnamed protein product [Nezara viridula]|uniref:Uncharacterized protein n=1 Tax=Nezara viridula TaxID=85310 RepID=A0A9P0MQ17_NEZVI|nr:unnamed protein product [Nezara viridula]
MYFSTFSVMSPSHSLCSSLLKLTGAYCFLLSLEGSHT